ncbi:hypothetical protein [Halobacterium hubeiense]|uniref:hypothetical protein n=1 Tax=Halobacterium hubeiense TaxID=1407499 RepID=UPI003C76D8CA
MAPRHTLALPAVAAVVVLALVAGGATAAPPPEDACGVCDSYFESAVADAGGPDVAVEQSRLDVHVRENGSARVLARNELAPGDAAWVANNTGAVADALAPVDTGVGDADGPVSVRVVDDAAVVEYTDSGFAYRSFGGVVVVDALAETPTGWTVNAELFALHAPGTHVAASHDRGVSVVEWTDHADDDYVTFAPGHGPASAAAARLALVAATAPAFLRGAAMALGPALAVLAVLFRAVGAVPDLTPDVDAQTAGTVVLGAGALVAGAVVATGQVSLYFMAAGAVPLFTAIAAVAAGGAVHLGVRDTTRLAAAAVGVPLSVGVLAAFVGAFAHPAVAGWTMGRALTAGVLAAQVGVFAVLGATRDSGSGWLRFAAVAAPAVAVVALVGPTVLVLAWTVALVVVAPLSYAFGASVGRSRLRSV